MKNVSLFLLIEEDKKKLSNFGLDEESSIEFKSSIIKTTDSESLGQSLLEKISKKGFNDNVDSIIDLIKNGANVDYQNEAKGDFPLIVCARKGYLKTFITLIKAGANVNLTNNFLTTTLMAAARHGYKDMVEILILLGADVNAQCKDGDTALISAKRHDQIECFDILIRHNAHFTHQNLMNESIQKIVSSRPFNIPNSIWNKEVSNGTSSDDTTKLVEEAKLSLKKVLDNH